MSYWSFGWPNDEMSLLMDICFFCYGQQPQARAGWADPYSAEEIWDELFAGRGYEVIVLQPLKEVWPFLNELFVAHPCPRHSRLGPKLMEAQHFGLTRRTTSSPHSSHNVYGWLQPTLRSGEFRLGIPAPTTFAYWLRP